MNAVDALRALEQAPDQVLAAVEKARTASSGCDPAALFGCDPRALCCPCTASGALDGFDTAADAALPCLELVGSVAGALASPCIFPVVFLCPAKRPDGSDASGDSGGWAVSMLQAPGYRPLWCAGACLLPCVAQYFVRRLVLGYDMGRYSLFQGQLDGPYCFAHCNPALPYTLVAGTLGESRCPDAFACAESLLCPVCAFYASRSLQRSERGLDLDPTERRVDLCLLVTGQVASTFAVCGGLCSCLGCLVRCCAPDGDGELRDAGEDCSRLGGACGRIARALFRGMWFVRTIAIGCMSAQMAHEGLGGGRAHTAAQPPASYGFGSAGEPGAVVPQGPLPAPGPQLPPPPAYSAYAEPGAYGHAAGPGRRPEAVDISRV